MSNKQEEVYESLYNALNLMVAATWAERGVREAAGHKAKMSDKAWAKEHSIVRYGMGRRMGHTTMAVRLAKEIAERGVGQALVPDLLC